MGAADFMKPFETTYGDWTPTEIYKLGNGPSTQYICVAVCCQVEAVFSLSQLRHHPVCQACTPVRRSTNLALARTKPSDPKNRTERVAKRRTFYNAIAKSALNRHLDFELTEDQAETLGKLNCFYCGAAPAHHNTLVGGPFNTLDRVDSKRGYSPDNVVPACLSCNLAKKSTPIDEFKDWVCRVHNFWASH